MSREKLIFLRKNVFGLSIDKVIGFYSNVVRSMSVQLTKRNRRMLFIVQKFKCFGQ